MNTITYKGTKWSYICLNKKGFLSLDDIHEFMERTIEMHVDGDLRRKVKGENFEGVLYTHREYHMLESFGGQEYIGELETNRGKATISVLLRDPESKDSLLPAYSRN